MLCRRQSRAGRLGAEPDKAMSRLSEWHESEAEGTLIEPDAQLAATPVRK